MNRLVFGLVAAIGIAGTASAETSIMFGGFNPRPQGTVGWAGGAGAMTGSQIPIGYAVGYGTPSNAGTSLVTGSLPCYFGSCGELQFSTGSFAGTTVGSSGQTLLNFNPGGSVTIMGGIPGAGPIPGGVLLSGSFTGMSTYDTQNGVFSVVAGSGVNSYPSAVRNFFGVQEATELFEFTLSVHIWGLDSWVGGFNNPVFSATLTNSPVPEPATIVLMSLVLLGCATIFRRRLHRESQ